MKSILQIYFLWNNEMEVLMLLGYFINFLNFINFDFSLEE